MDNQPSARLLRLKDVLSKCSLSKSNLYSLLKEGRFPQPVKLSPHGRLVVWRESDIDKWIASLPAAEGK